MSKCFCLPSEKGFTQEGDHFSEMRQNNLDRATSPETATTVNILTFPTPKIADKMVYANSADQIRLLLKEV